MKMHRMRLAELIVSDFASRINVRRVSPTADSEWRCTHSHAWRASSPVNRATHYHKCPRRARPTRKSVSQIARVGLCHLSPPARSPATAPPRCVRLVSTERSARSDRARSSLLPHERLEWRFRVHLYAFSRRHEQYVNLHKIPLTLHLEELAI